MAHKLMLYNTLKILHVISSSILFGTGMGTALYMWLAQLRCGITARAHAFRRVVIADWLFTTPSAVFQALSGLTMVYVRGYLLQQSSYQLHNWWVLGSIMGYSTAGLCWLPVLYLQNAMANMLKDASKSNTPLKPSYNIYFRLWFALGIPAFLSLIWVYYLMTTRPS